MGKRTDYAALRMGLGLTRGLSEEFVLACEAKDVPIEAVHRLVTPKGRETMARIAELIRDDWLAEQPKPAGQDAVEPLPNGGMLPANHYRVHVTYAPLPSFVELKREFGEDNVSVIFDGRPWELHSSCAGMKKTPGDKTFLVKDFGREWKSEEAIAWGRDQRTQVAPDGYRPATHDEEYEFHEAHPELLDLIALGSFAMDGDGRYVAVVWDNDGQRTLVSVEFEDGWGGRGLCLFVSK